MSKVLYPKQERHEPKSHRTDPWVVLFTDPTGQLPSEVRGYPNEMQAKAAAWYHCRAVGFRTAAELFTRAEWEEIQQT